MEEARKENPSDANQTTRRYLDSLLIEERLVDAKEPNIGSVIFGKKFQTPIMMPAFSHLDQFLKGKGNAMVAYAQAAKQLGMLNWVGMIENDGFGEILDVGVETVRIIKPYADKNKILDQIAYAEKHGAFAVGIDIDHVFGMDGKYDVVIGEEMTCQTQEDLKEYVNATKLPFIVKGILSVKDAAKCAACGISGIVVSHHHGRMPYAIPPLMALPEIAKEVSGIKGFEIFADCGINSGADAFKGLALGANAVSVGRAIMPGLSEDGAEGVVKYVQKMNEQLAMLMGYTGFHEVSDIEPSVLWHHGKRMQE